MSIDLNTIGEQQKTLQKTSRLWFGNKKECYLQALLYYASDKKILQHFYVIIIYRNTWLGKQKLFIIDLIVNIILDYLKKTVHKVFTITTNMQGGVL